MNYIFTPVKISITDKTLLLVDIKDFDDTKIPRIPMFGYFLTDGFNVWDGGFGILSRNQTMTETEITPRLEQVKNDLMEGKIAPDFRRWCLLEPIY